MGAALYEPINVYKPVAPDIGIVDGPFEYLTVAGMRMPLPFTTRMTVVRLANGDLLLHSPIAFDDALAGELQQLGTVRHFVSPNQFHYAHIGEWQKAFPGTLAWASSGARDGLARAAPTSTSRGISRNNRLQNGEMKSTRPRCRAASSRSSYSSITLPER